MPLAVTVFSDFTCPYSYVTEAALRRRAASGDVRVQYRAFELFPTPVPTAAPADEPGLRDSVRPLAEEEALPLHIPSFRPRTRKAHEAAAFAAERGRHEEMRAAIFHAYWAEERDIGRVDVLLSLIRPLGIDPEELKIALDIDRHRDEVLRDQELARRLGVRAVPTLYLGTGPHARILVGARTGAGLDEAIESDYEL